MDKIFNNLNDILDELPRILREFADEAHVRIASQSISKHMIDAPGAEGTPNPGDTLRIVTGRLARSLVRAAESRSGMEHEGFRELTVSADRFRLVVGSRVPYAGVHERGFAPRNLKARPYLEPGLIDSRPVLEQMLQDKITKFIEDKLK